jgi:hypothetical protein
MRKLILVLALVVPSIAAAATTVSEFRSRHQSAFADFLNIETSTCAAGIETFVNVAGAFFVTKEGSTTETPFATVTISVDRSRLIGRIIA